MCITHLQHISIYTSQTKMVTNQLWLGQYYATAQRKK